MATSLVMFSSFSSWLFNDAASNEIIEFWWNKNWQKNQKHSENTNFSTTISTTNTIRTDPGSNPDRRDGKTAINSLRYGKFVPVLN
jgi:hypothetical protein